MSDGKYQIPNATHDSRGVDRAIEITKALVQTARGHHDTDRDAITEAARHCRLAPSVLRRFFQPSRWPKQVDADILERLRAGYLRFLRQQLAAIETEIARIEASGSVDAGAEHLLDAARALVRRIEAVAGRR